MPDLASLRRLLQDELYGQVPDLAFLDQGRRVECPHEGEFQLFQRTLLTPFGTELDVLTARPVGESRGHLFGINFNGNHSLSAIPTVPLSRTWTSPWRTKRDDEVSNEAERNRLPHAYPFAKIVESGFSVSTCYVSDILPDRGASLDLLREINSTVGAVGLWGWGLASIAFTLERNSPITFVGHSRLGKAALCAGALFDVASNVVAIQSGTGGSAPFATEVGESVEKLVEVFPFWFHPQFQHASSLSFDSDSIFEACLPARILLLGADEDLWADPEGSAQMLQKAISEGRAHPDSKSIIRPGKHEVTLQDWDFILDFLKDAAVG